MKVKFGFFLLLIYKKTQARIGNVQIEDSKYLPFSVKRKAFIIFLKHIKNCWRMTENVKVMIKPFFVSKCK